VETTSTLTCDVGNFLLTNMVEAFEGDSRVFGKTWRFSVPRDGM
jgi:hypothetical protein